MGTFNNAVDLWVAADPETRSLMLMIAWALAAMISFAVLLSPPHDVSYMGKALGFIAGIFSAIALVTFAAAILNAIFQLWLPSSIGQIPWISSTRWGHVLVFATLGVTALVLRLIPASSDARV